MHWMPLLYMMEIIWSGCGLATLKVKMRKMSPLFYSFQVIWNWTGNYLLILYNSDQKGICNDISLSLFVLKIGLRLKKSSIKFEIVFFVVEQIRLEFEPIKERLSSLWFLCLFRFQSGKTHYLRLLDCWRKLDLISGPMSS